MAALSAIRLTKSRNLGNVVRYKMPVSVTIYAGSMVMLNSVGLAVAAAASASNQGVVGVATKSVTSPSSGDTFIDVQEGTFLFAGDTIGDTSVGLVVYADDDQTIDETQATNAPRAGYLTEVESASSGWVRIGIGMHAA